MASPISRRMFFALSASVAVVACSKKDSDTQTTEPVLSSNPTTVAPTTSPVPASNLVGDPFTLGVASGDPTSESVILWTRLAIDALNGGGMPDEDIDVLWEVSSTDQFTDIIASGISTAEVRFGHSLHVDVPLSSKEDFVNYRFKVGEYTSPIGQTRLASAAGSTTTLKIAAVSCQNYTDGFYNAYGDLVEQQPDVVTFLGDYIYESGVGSLDATTVRLHNSDEPKDLVAYRNRYGLYKGDPLLQAAHASCPWIVIWDDHEVENNYANLSPQDAADTEGYAARRAAAYQAWWEHMPVRLEPPVSESFKIYRQFSWGDLINLLVVDGRQYRNDQACGDAVLSTQPACDEALDPTRTMLGTEQEKWFSENINDTTKVWNVMANQTVMTDIRLGAAILNYDQWDGYAPDRNRILSDIVDQGVENFVVLTGDIHLAGVGQLTTDGNPTTAMGAEFVSTSISSSGNVSTDTEGLLIALPNIIDAETSHRGYTLHTVTTNDWTAEFRIVDNNLVEDSSTSVWKTFKVMAGSPAITEI
ncbi:MAG: alkaline phosphatase D family protein [Actinomycetes bacterium]